MAVHYEVREGESLLVKGPANIIVKTGDVPLVGDPDNLPEPPIDEVAPTIVAIMPTTALTTDPEFALSVAGTDFTASSVVNFDGIDVATTFSSDTQISALVTPPAAAAECPVIVKNGAAVSNTMNLSVTAPAGRKR